ncbi:glycosyltransferase family 4 protein [Rhizobium halophytocola]|uniref:Glycosyltransferase involved in cell wall biosynthesis n=1 Tax=Rhizobium halophytocola TaxID=735519 RepID=A0ABS4E3W9_9HYPH|nr:glycosyltransferase family 4 protein [Rhizobium halophytocola]MBP1852645.1 glycosyltransferase involved in cell wall biosynthesis [Rhizobium halophytocola]
MNHLRILQLLPALGDGGVERSAVEMATYLSDRRMETWVASRGGPLVADIEACGAHHATLAVGSKSPFALVKAAFAVARLIDEQRIDIVHARSRAPAWAALMGIGISRRKPRFLTTFHGTYGHRSALKRLYNSAMLRTPVVIANSQFIRDHITTVYGYPRDQIVVAPRGIDPARFDPANVSPETRRSLRQQLGAGDDEQLVVMIGRITGWKGHAVLIEAFARLRRVNARLAFVGSGVETTIAEAKAKVTALGIADRVLFAGSRRDVPAVLAAADLAVSASTRPEAFGRAAIEAQAMRTPIIATDHGGSRETVLHDKTGWLVTPGDVDHMADTIRKALSDPTRLHAMGEAGREHILANFTTQSMLDKEFSAYERVMHGGARLR